MLDNTKAGLMTLFLGSIGDIISRILWYNCSVDKPWTLFFFLPPLSLISSMLYFFNMIEKGVVSCASSFDWFLFVIPAVTIIINILLRMVVQNILEDKLITILGTILPIVIVLIMYLAIRMYKVTSNENVKCSVDFDKNLLRSFFIASITNVSILVFNSVLPQFENLPIVGIGFRAWNSLETIPGVRHAILLTLAHYLTNLYDNMPNSLDNICKSET